MHTDKQSWLPCLQPFITFEQTSPVDPMMDPVKFKAENSSDPRTVRRTLGWTLLIMILAQFVLSLTKFYIWKS